MLASMRSRLQVLAPVVNSHGTLLGQEQLSWWYMLLQALFRLSGVCRSTGAVFATWWHLLCRQLAARGYHAVGTHHDTMHHHTCSVVMASRHS